MQIHPPVRQIDAVRETVESLVGGGFRRYSSNTVGPGRIWT